MKQSERIAALENQLKEEHRTLVYPHSTQDEFGRPLYDHPYLKELLNSGVIPYGTGALNHIYYKEACAYLKTFPNHIWIECIAVPSKCRGEGRATLLMEILCDVADRTNTVLKLQISKVDGRATQMVHRSPAIFYGSQGNNKIPVRMLRGWYEGFGFQFIARLMDGSLMVREPRTKS